MYSKSDVLEAKRRLHELLDEKDKLVEQSRFIPPELLERIDKAYVQAVTIQQRYSPTPDEYDLNRKRK